MPTGNLAFKGDLKAYLTNYVTFNDFATAATTGVVKTSAQYGVSTSSYTKNLTGAEFQTWLSTHNTEVYYPLVTPTDTANSYFVGNASGGDGVYETQKAFKDGTPNVIGLKMKLYGYTNN